MEKAGKILLMVSLLMLLVAPGTALSQGGTQSGWTDTPPTLNGKIGANEWANATKVALTEVTFTEAGSLFDGLGLDSRWEGEALEYEVSAEQANGWLYFMNDDRFLYVAATLDVGAPAGEPDQARTELALLFEDEPVIGDGLWAANQCADNPDEGKLASMHEHERTSSPLEPDLDHDYDHFIPITEEGPCLPPQSDPPGYRCALAYSPATLETRINLVISPLQALPGDCVNLGVALGDMELYLGPPQEFYQSTGLWPADLYVGEFPDDLGEVCLAQPPEEEFVPEPSGVVLLGSGLAGLAVYAGLQWRARRRK